jgi:DNA-directed RNA polymerase subunit RPC12/RpoP
MSKRQTRRTVEAPCSTCGRETTWQVVRENRSEDYVRCTVCRAAGYRARSFWQMRRNQGQAESPDAERVQRGLRDRRRQPHGPTSFSNARP